MERVHTNANTGYQRYSDDVVNTWNRHTVPTPRLEWDNETDQRIRFNPHVEVSTFDVDKPMIRTQSAPRTRDADARKRLDHFDMSEEDVRSALDTTYAKILVIVQDLNAVSDLDKDDDRLRLHLNKLTHQLDRLSNLTNRLPEDTNGYWKNAVSQLTEYSSIFASKKDSVEGGGSIAWPLYSICLLSATFAIAMFPR